VIQNFEIGSWKGWAKKLDGFVQVFHKTYGKYPNLLVANDSTMRRLTIAAAASPDKLRSASGESPEAGAYAKLSGFAGNGYKLVFSVDNAVTDKTLSLIFVADSIEEASR
jgi:hypothetical protein